ncbi:MAG: O-antigen export system permease protein RfbD [uncultured Nocardioidaceae bacterium]|uniref:O-antigen export system permease protein RfbD n=1 Tax=uncultured Nocardioidaceae bacterium TaxID=253824 RepID=A0A6J4MQK5_9ACTN|nr:MAG: O-antigen export system permease protein RfbD [uncultured Nocardioidaceae bacterium]
MTTTQAAHPDRVPDEPLVAPGDHGGLHNVFRERYLLRLLVKKELQARYQGSFLGLVWSYVQPLVRFLAYYLVVGYVLGLNRGVQNFPLHIFAGMVMVHYFTETFSAGTRSIVRNGGLIQKLSMPREMFPVASMLVSGYHTLPQLGILLVAVLITGWDPTLADVGAGLLGFAIIATFGMALALLFSAANVFFRDFHNIVQTVGIFVTWSAPMIYPYDRIADLVGGTWIEQVYLANPIANGVLLFQQLFWIPTTDPDTTPIPLMPDHLLTRGLIVLAACLVILAFSQWVFSRLEGKFAERL